MTKKIVILGAGPCGLAAAYQLSKVKINEFEIFEKNSYPGGLCASFHDDKGFTWDTGGHVTFSDDLQVNEFLNDVMNNEWVCHKRDSFVHHKQKLIPFPFQNNLRHLEPQILLECVQGLLQAKKQNKTPDNFKEWIVNTYGQGIANHFMYPYNEKIWTYPLEEMDFSWTDEYVSQISINKTLENIILKKDDLTWGKNSRFKYPLKGGTGAIYSNASRHFKEKLHLNKQAVEIDSVKRVVHFQDGSTVNYDYLINTTPLNKLVKMLSDDFKDLVNASFELKYNSVLIVGIGINKVKESINKGSWFYFPDPEFPFYRVTLLSKYSSYNVPDIKTESSFLTEIAYSPETQIDKNILIQKTIEKLKQISFISEKDTIETIFTKNVKMAYPVPTLNRNKSLRYILPRLEQLNIFSRGWFGSWIYEASNMEKSIKQGFETVEKILHFKPEVTLQKGLQL